MKRLVRCLVADAMLLALLGSIVGCSRPLGPAESGTPSAVAPKQPLPPLTARQQRVVLDGLVVTLTLPDPPTSDEGKAKLAAGNGKFVIRLIVENSTDATMTMRVHRNAPGFVGSDGKPVMIGARGVNGGSGQLNVPRSGVSASSTALAPEGLAPHGSIEGYVETAFDTAGRGMTVQWTFSPDRVAVFQLP